MARILRSIIKMFLTPDYDQEIEHSERCSKEIEAAEYEIDAWMKRYNASQKENMDLLVQILRLQSERDEALRKITSLENEMAKHN